MTWNAETYNTKTEGYFLTIIPRARMRPKAEWAIDSEATRARQIIVLVKSK